MKTNLICHGCKAAFQRPSTRGRIPQYCTEQCRRQSNATRRGQKLGKLVRARDADAVAVSRSVAERGAEIERLSRMRQPLRILDQITLIEHDLKDLKAHAVQQARQQGNSWETIAGTLHLSAKYAGRLFTGGHLSRRRQNRRRRAQIQPPAFRLAAEAKLPDTGLPNALAHPAAVESRTPESGSAEGGEPGGDTSTEADPAEDGAPPGRRAEGRDTALISRALSHLQRSSGTTIKKLSRAAGVSPSFVCRVLSGHKMPSWAVTQAIAEACGANPDDVRILWHTAQGARPRPPMIRRNDRELVTEALATLRSALRGLHLAAFSPPPSLLCELARGPLTPRDITDLLDKKAGAVLPDWPTIDKVVDALNADADMVRPLWEHVQVAQDPYWTPEHGSRSVLAAFG
ncbi:helix-turn-helix domain-containing protein [Kitasatospora sp. NPDC058444]|uniref:helix-turn-helix domain-containing protein n=1 Tax=Kitasatospora sp. NPDC058444 TaxID=3346504 RepID=UPI00365AE19A